MRDQTEGGRDDDGGGTTTGEAGAGAGAGAVAEVRRHPRDRRQPPLLGWPRPRPQRRAVAAGGARRRTPPRAGPRRGTADPAHRPAASMPTGGGKGGWEGGKWLWRGLIISERGWIELCILEWEYY